MLPQCIQNVIITTCNQYEDIGTGYLTLCVAGGTVVLEGGQVFPTDSPSSLTGHMSSARQLPSC